jgi:imidazolonepropionase-like amidohydrolase
MLQKLFKNGVILDVVSERLLTDHAVLIEGKRIKKIAPVQTFAEFEAHLDPKAIFDLNGMYLIPGLIDAHIHLVVIQSSNESETVLENLRGSETLKVLYGARHAKETLESGFTTVRDVGLGDNLALKDAIGRGIIPGPRIVACGWLGMTGGQQQRVVSEWQYNVSPRAQNIGVDGPWEVRKKVRELVSQGYDCIKTFATGGGYIKHPWYNLWADQRNFTLEELRALVDEAHAAGRKVACHAWASVEGIKNAIAAGVDTLEHAVFLDNEDVTAMKQRNITYVATLAFMNVIWDVVAIEKMQYLPVEIESARNYLDAHLTSFRRAQDHGVKIAMGSDTYRVLKQGENACEIEWLVKSGLTEMQALAASTITAAEALAVNHLVGSIEEGKLADFLVVKPNPLDDVSILRNRNNLKMIVKDGDIVRSRLQQKP